MRIEELDLEITPSGDVFFQGKQVVTRRSPLGYGEVRLILHRLIAQAFHGSPPTKSHVCDHIDGNPRNNSASNLQWITQRENCQKSRKTHLHKLTPKQVAEVRALKPKPHKTLKQMADEWNVAINTIAKVRSGDHWPNGWHTHSNGILTADQIKQIRDWTPQAVTAASLSRKYKVNESTIRDVWHGRHRFGN